MRRPLLVDLYCGAGGAAVGYWRAGFRVIGVDRQPQKHYPFEFRRGNALLPPINLRMADVIHASPPCQAHSVANNIHANTHPDLIPPTRQLLQATGKPYVIENVVGAPLVDPVMLCGRALGLGVRRHRLFESNRSLAGTVCPPGHPGGWLSVYGHTVLTRGQKVGLIASGRGNNIDRAHIGLASGQRAMGIDWMEMRELSDAIPPAYTEYLGHQLMELIQ